MNPLQGGEKIPATVNQKSAKISQSIGATHLRFSGIVQDTTANLLSSLTVNNCENQSAFGKVTGRSTVVLFDSGQLHGLVLLHDPVVGIRKCPQQRPLYNNDLYPGSSWVGCNDKYSRGIGNLQSLFAVKNVNKQPTSQRQPL